MRILYIYTDHFRNYDILLTLQQTKHSVDTIDTPFMTWEPTSELLSVLDDKLTSNSYDCVLSFGYVPYISDICTQKKTPYVAWTYDSILHALYNESIENPYNFLFIFDKAEYHYLKKHFHLPHIYHLPLAVNTERISSIAISVSDEAKYTSDISFVGDLYQHNVYNELHHSLSPEQQAYFEQAFSYFHGNWGAESIFNWFSTEDANYLQTILPEYLKNDECMPNARYFADTILSKPIASRERIHMLNLLAKKHAVTLYTKDSTDTSVLQNVTCKGYLNYYDEMYKAFFYSKINLNSTLHSMESAISLRCFDIMGAGGFLLTNYQEELLDYFVPDKELVYYKTFEELAEKAAFYLKHEDLRTAIAQNGYQIVCAEHTYQKRIQTILSTLEGEL